MRNLRGLGMTVLLTTHYLDEAQELADRVAIVKDGRIVAAGPARPSSGPSRPATASPTFPSGRRVEHETDDPTDLLHRLTSDALARGERLEGLEVNRPTLEDVYLELTRGRSVSTAGARLGAVPLRAQAVLAQPHAAFFNFVLPLLLLLLVATAFSSEGDELDILIPGMAGMSVMATTFTALAYVLVYRREEGILKRVRGTPMPAISYLGGMIGVGGPQRRAPGAARDRDRPLLYGVDWPANWLLLAGFSTLGVVCFGSLGVAFAHAIPNVDSGPAWVNAVFLPLIFISGVFYSSDALPGALKAVAEALPQTTPTAPPSRTLRTRPGGN